ncbi:hypothetical protein SADUNF_Sadunf07G0121700 [Salix dunnii]|uniref:Uncharacterized protein n=1 Tax=Salix dunnii TaxID=1413687 RepID=A0A835JWT9_9ROSI|nr:hypothetical protein SADUNF_Sadunf07G0121700 [Salix dunnii]
MIMCSSRRDNELQEKPLKWYPSQETRVQKEHSEKPNLILVILHLKPTKRQYSIWEKTGSCQHVLLQCYKSLPYQTNLLDYALEVAGNVAAFRKPCPIEKLPSLNSGHSKDGTNIMHQHNLKHPIRDQGRREGTDSTRLLNKSDAALLITTIHD